jgi:hypothetical protein
MMMEDPRTFSLPPSENMAGYDLVSTTAELLMVTVSFHEDDDEAMRNGSGSEIA